MCKKSISNERKVQGYLKPKTYANFKAFVQAEEMSDSEGVNHILTTFFNSLTPAQKQSYLHKARGLNQF
jgi:hypothetical protein